MAGNIAARVALKNCTPLIKCITKIDRAIYVAEDLDLVMLMYNLLEYSSNYSKTTESSWLYSKDEATNFNNDTENSDEFRSFKYKAKFLGKQQPQMEF